MTKPEYFDFLFLAFRFEGGTTGRDVIWIDTLELLKSNFWFGIGIDNYQETYAANFSLLSWTGRYVPDGAHNQILDWVIRLGIMGLPLVMFVYYISVKNGIMALLKFRSYEDRIVIYGLFGAIIAICTRSIFESGTFLLSGVYLFPSLIYWTWLIMLIKINNSRASSTNDIIIQ